MRLNTLSPAEGSKKAGKRLGRGIGSGLGKTGGRGHKGQNSRSGGGVRRGFEGGQMPLHMRMPKLKGFKNPAKVTYQVVNVSDLEKAFSNGGDVTVADIVAAGLARKNQPVKVLGNGEISVKLNVTANKFSGSAKQKIEAAGGTATEAK